MTCGRSICLPGLEVDCLPTSSLGTPPFAPSSGTPIVAPNSESEQPKAGSPVCTCTKATSGCSIHPRGRDEWIASMRDSLASLLASRENRKGPKTSGNFSGRCFAVWMPSDPNMSSLKTRQESSPQEPIYAYAAGLIDGEGCIRIQKQKNKLAYIPVVQVSMSDKARGILVGMQKEFGGNLYSQDFHQEKWSKQTTWRVNGAEAVAFLRKVLPNLMLKPRQAELALSLDKMRLQQGWTKKTRRIAEEMKQEMHSLNAKGPAQNAGGFYEPEGNLFGITAPFSGRWPNAGMMLGGRCYPLPTLERRTFANAGGACVPTPTVHGNHNRKGMSPSSGDGLATFARKFPTPTSSMLTAQDMEQARYAGTDPDRPKYWPTPRANKIGGYSSPDFSPTLEQVVKQWPTPRATDGSHGGRVTPQKSRLGGNLIEAVSASMFATPTARDWKSGKASRETMAKNSRPLSEQIGGLLNATWVEWLQAFPIGFTVCAAWEMLRSRCKPPSRGKRSGKK